ncbi:lipoyl(octanoyl) transferase LipB [Candidatus Riesia pediculischaeffi]|uniref:Octanoyltransferase n=2 Tax=Candidatus Riesia pediculischaeffi TaxID=428411 RepID=A0A1V0HKV0_9ENTR|nr:lipoyl(octanoyl) transferase LipB [Candidatus Riesia pediculischaeffi]ARC53455.1 octanoyltransferase [Candidatus Riesia pediculischaeffi]KIE63997.1 Octanoate-[acyl-carrier-protein]-protein-N-octan oyltransferase [Candidatus Riesia pediculischaeffi PTSU]
MSYKKIVFHDLGMQDYRKIYKRMVDFTRSRDRFTTDEIWMVEHLPVFTLGKSSTRKDLKDIARTDIPIVQSDRGGKITYHGPGQQIVYVLLNLGRRSTTARNLVDVLEKIVIGSLKEIGISSHNDEKYRGVYTDDGQKICSLGLKISRGCSLHGLSINVNMDLSPFTYISPCGLSNVRMTQVSNFVPDVQMQSVKSLLLKHFYLLSK